MPAKSVTAIIGVIGKNGYLNKEEQKNKNDNSFEEKNCRFCRLYKECKLRKKGVYCGARK